jgi:hypothetical protein
MKRFGTALAVVTIAIFAAAGCNDYGNTFQNNTGAVLSFLSPSNISACQGSNCQSFTLTITGSGFVLQTKVHWNGTTLATTVPVDSTGTPLGNIVTAVVPANLYATPGVATVVTINPASGAGNNGLSNTIAFIVNNPPNPAPTVSAVSPSCAQVGGALSITVTGTGFLPTPSDLTTKQYSTLNWTVGSSVVSFIPPAITVTPGSNSGTITATIPAANISAGTANVTVFNPPSLALTGVSGSTGSGGGTSSISSASAVTIQTAVCPTAAKSQSSADANATVVEETPAVSMDGRYVAYTAAQDGVAQIFVRDTCEGVTSGCQARTSLVSVAPDGSPASDESHAPSMSSDGRYIAFSSAATNLVENAPTGREIYLRDTCVGADASCKPKTSLVSQDASGALVGTESILPSVSSSGRFIAFLAVTPSHTSKTGAASPNASASGANSGFRQVFIRDTCLGATNCTPKTTRISLQPGDGTGTSVKPAGPALNSSGDHLAAVGADSATLFTRSIAVDDRVFLAIANRQQ